METDYRERCLKCKWLAPQLKPPCGRVFDAKVSISPLGGTIDIGFTPGMIPIELVPKMEDYLGRVFEWMQKVIQLCPIWDEIAVMMSQDPERETCPGRDPAENPYLKIVR